MKRRSSILVINLLLLSFFQFATLSAKRQKEEVYTYTQEFDSLFVEALLLKNAEKPLEVKALYERCHEINPNSAIVSYELSKCYFKENNDIFGIAFLVAASELAPDNYFYQKKLATIYVQANMIDRAIVAYKSILSNHFPEEEENLYQLSRLYKRKNMPSRRYKILEKLEKRYGVSRTTSLEKVQILFDNGKVKASFQALDQLIEELPLDPYPLVYKGDLYQQLKKYSEAHSCYELALGLDPENPYAMMALVGYYDLIGDKENMLVYLYKCFGSRTIPLSSKLDLLDNVIKYYQNDVTLSDKVERAYKAMLIAEPGNSLLHANYAKFLSSFEGREKEIEEELEASVLIDPSCGDCWISLIDLTPYTDSLLFLSRVKEAKKVLPDEMWLNYKEGLFYQLNNQPEKATSLFSNAFYGTKEVASPFKLELYLRLSTLYLKKNQNDSLYYFLEEGMKAFPEVMVLKNNYAYYKAVAGEEDLESLKTLSEETIVQDPLNPEYLDTYAYLLFKLKEYKMALFYIEQAIEYSVGQQVHPEVLEHYGDILFFLGDKEKALEKWKEANSLQASKSLQQKIEEKKYAE